MGHNEMLIGEASRAGTATRPLSASSLALRSAGGWTGFDARPIAVKNFLAYTLQRLGVDYIDVYRPARLDSNVPIEDTIGAIADLVKAGYVRHIGLSEVGANCIRRAAAVHPIVDLQIEYSLISRGIEATILPACRELGISITAYGVLSRGLISGHWNKGQETSTDFRAYSPRFQKENVDKNLALVEVLRKVANAKGATVAQMAIAWVAAQGADIMPLVGSRKRDQLKESLGALELKLSPDDLKELNRPSLKTPQPEPVTTQGRWPISTAKPDFKIKRPLNELGSWLCTLQQKKKKRKNTERSLYAIG
jgi:pyridoxine 4-dehydrogenase